MENNTMKDKVLTIQQMKHLQSIGLDISNASMMWINFYENEPFEEFCELRIMDKSFKGVKKIIPTFTFEDILNVLPKQITDTLEPCQNDDSDYYDLTIKSDVDIWHVTYSDLCLGDLKSVSSKNILTAAFKMLLWCIANEHLKTK